jgi:hypothetical protein
MLQLKDSLQIDERKEKMEDQEIILIFVFRSSWYPSLNKFKGRPPALKHCVITRKITSEI